MQTECIPQFNPAVFFSFFKTTISKGEPNIALRLQRVRQARSMDKDRQILNELVGGADYDIMFDIFNEYIQTCEPIKNTFTPAQLNYLESVKKVQMKWF